MMPRHRRPTPEFTNAFTPHWRENCKLRDVQFGGDLGDIDVHSGLERFFSWWLTYPSEKYEFISWDDDIPYGKTKAMCQTTNQIVLRGNRV